MAYGVEDISVIYTTGTTVLSIFDALPRVEVVIAPVVDATPGVTGTEWLDRQAVGEQTGVSCPSAYWLHNNLALISETDENGWLAIIDQNRHGHLIPAQLTDNPTTGLAAIADPRRVIRAPAAFRTRATPYVLEATAPLEADTATVTLNVVDGHQAWCLLTTAGTVDGTARPTGLTALANSTDTNPRNFTNVSGVGWILTGTEQAYD